MDYFIDDICVGEIVTVLNSNIIIKFRYNSYERVKKN